MIITGFIYLSGTVKNVILQFSSLSYKIDQCVIYLRDGELKMTKKNFERIILY